MHAILGQTYRGKWEIGPPIEFFSSQGYHHLHQSQPSGTFVYIVALRIPCVCSEDKLMSARFGKLLFFCLLASMTTLFPLHVGAQERETPPPPPSAPLDPSAQKPLLNRAIMCEKVENLNPIRHAIVFSVSAGQVYCYTSFDPVVQPSLIYHRWFHHNELSTQTRLRLYPPKWATYSVIQLRETDKGPWRVEISDQNGHIFEVLRFSITD